MEIFRVLSVRMISTTVYVSQNVSNPMLKKAYISLYVSYSLINLTFKTNK